MSRLSRILGIEIDVQARNAERLDDVTRRVVRLAKSMAELRSLSGDIGGAQNILGALRGDIAGQSQTEANRVLADQIRLTKQAIAAETERATTISRIAAGNRDYAAAVHALQAEQAKYIAGSSEWLRLEERKQRLLRQETNETLRLEEARRRAARSFESDLASQIAARARLMAAQGNLSGAIGSIAVNAGDFGDRDQTRLLTLKAALERRYRAEVMETHEAQMRAAAQQEASLLRQNRLNVQVLAAGKDYAGALARIQADQAKVIHGSEAWLTLENRRLAVMRAQGAEATRQSATFERRNRANYNNLASLSIQEANLLALKGDRQGALALLQSRLGSVPDGSRQQLTMLQAHQRILNEINTEEAKRVGLIGKVGSALSSGLTMMLRVLGAFFLLNAFVGMVGRGITRFIFDPLLGLTKQVITSTDEFRKMEATFAGIAGSLRDSKVLVQDIIRASAGLPITPLEAVQAVRQTAFVPTVARQLGGAAGQGRDQFIERLLRTISGLATINPQQGPEGAGFAIREALAGQFRSIRNRFDISPDVVAATIGKRLTDLRRDPTLTLRAISQFVDSFVGPEVVDQLGSLLSVQGRKLRGFLEQFFAKIGEQGLYDRLSQRLGAFNAAFSKFIGSSASTTAAAKISAALDSFINGLINLGSRLVSGAVGHPVNLAADLEAGDLGKIAETAAEFIRSMSDAAGKIVEFGEIVAGVAGRLIHFATGPVTLEEKQARIAELQSRASAWSGLPLPYGMGGGIPGGTGVAEAFGRVIGPFGPLPQLFGKSLMGGRTPREEQELARLLADVRLRTGGGAPRTPMFNSEAMGALASSSRGVGFFEGFNAEKLTDEAKGAGSRLRQAMLGFNNFLNVTEDSLRETQNQVGPEVTTIRQAVATLDAGMKEFFSGKDGIPILFDKATEGLDTLNKIRGTASGAIDSLSGRLDRLQKQGPQGFGENLKNVLGLEKENLADQLARGEKDPWSGINLGWVRGRFMAVSQEMASLSPERIQSEFDSRVSLMQGALEQLRGFLGVSGGGTGTSTGLIGVIERITGVTKSTSSLLGQFTRAGAVELRFIDEHSKAMSASGRIGLSEQVTGNVLAGLSARSGVRSFIGGTAGGIPNLGVLRSAGQVPMDTDSVGRLIAQIEGGFRAKLELGGEAARSSAGREAVDSLQQLLAGYRKLDDVAPDTLDRIKEAMTKLKDETDDFVRTTRDIGTNISSSFKTGIADSLVASFTGATKDIEGIMTSMARRILDTFVNVALEFSLIRGLLNPALNFAFGLTGTNALPTLGGGATPMMGPPAPTGGAHGGLFVRAASGASIFASSAAMLTRTNTMIPLRGGGLAHTVEDGTPELITPTRGGGIALRIQDGGRRRAGDDQVTFTIINMVDSVSMVQAAARRDRRTIVNPVVADLRGRGVTRQTIRSFRR